jgi:peptide deformylase
MSKEKPLKKQRKGKALPVIRYPDPILSQVSVEVAVQDEDPRALLSFIRDLVATMRAAEGVGLAAIQVGIPKRILVFDDSDAADNPRALINPRIVWAGDEVETHDEGCLSFPGLYAPVVRPTTVRVEALNEHGTPILYEGEGLLARVLQHEIDHLNGLTFVQRAAPEVRKAALREYFDLGNPVSASDPADNNSK